MKRAPLVQGIKIDGNTRLIAHLGFPTQSFTAPLIYNPYFAARAINAAVVPMGVQAGDLAHMLTSLRRVSNFHGALVTMPHKVAVVELLDSVSEAVEIAQSCNAVRREADGTLHGELFDGTGFVRSAFGAAEAAAGTRAFVAGAGGVGSAIAAALAASRAAHITITDVNEPVARRLCERLSAHYTALTMDAAKAPGDPSGHDIVVNATPLGMREDDALPVEVDALENHALVADVVLKPEITPLLEAARERGHPIRTGVDMLFEQIPGYLDFFGFPKATASELRDVANLPFNRR